MPHTEERSLGELFSELSRDTTALVRQEIQLVKAELAQKISRATKDVLALASGAFLAYAGALALIAALILGMADLLEIAFWAAALIVGVAVLAVGYLMLSSGIRNLQKADPMPQRTVETLKDDVQWAKEQMR